MTVYVITSKLLNYKLPAGYTPLLVGADFNSNSEGYLTDNIGENISAKNKEFCELTGLYWIWKHQRDKNVGLVHYRRFFNSSKSRDMTYIKILLQGKLKPISTQNLDNMLANFDWIVSQPVKTSNKNNWDFYKVNHHIKDLENTRNIIKTSFPKYLLAFDKVMNQSNVLSPYNMFYTKRELLNDYCSWLFRVLFQLEKETSLTDYTDYQKRLYGFISERLLNVWLVAHKELKIGYLPVFRTDQNNRHYVFKLIKQKL